MPPLIPWFSPWVDYAIMALLAGLGTLLCWLGWRIGRPSADQCPACGYLRIGLPEGRLCPECGRPPTPVRRRLAWRGRWIIAGGLVVALAVPAYVAHRGANRYGSRYVTYVPPLVWVLPPERLPASGVSTTKRTTLIAPGGVGPWAAGEPIECVIKPLRARPPWDLRVWADLSIGGYTTRLAYPGDLAGAYLAPVTTDFDRDGRPEMLLCVGPKPGTLRGLNRVLPIEVGRRLEVLGSAEGRSMSLRDVDRDGVPELVGTGYARFSGKGYFYIDDFGARSIEIQRFQAGEFVSITHPDLLWVTVRRPRDIWTEW